LLWCPNPFIQQGALLNRLHALKAIAVALCAAGLAPNAFAQSLTPVTDATGAIYGYSDAATCVVWPAPAAFPVNAVMRHDKTVYVPGANGYFELVDIANGYAKSLTIAGLQGWRLPTVEESISFFQAVQLSSAPTVLRNQAALQRPYWTSDITPNSAAAVRPTSTGPRVHWYGRSAVDAYVWPVRHGGCGSVGTNPFAAR
jgi:hypothetical protein